MSHVHDLPSDYSGPVPEPQRRSPPGPHQQPPPHLPSAWLDPLSGEPGPLPASPPAVDDDGDIVVVDDDPETPAISAGRRSPRLPYGQGYVKQPGAVKPSLAKAPRSSGSTAEQRLLILDTWMRSGLPAGDYAPLVGVSKHTLYAWKTKFEELGPAGLMDRPRGGPRGSRLPELSKRAILMMKKQHPDWGVDRISDLLLRTQALAASPAAVGKILQEDGYLVEEMPMKRHPGPGKPFEKDHPGEMWQTDLFTFMLKRQTQRVYLVAFMDDHSRFIVSYGLHASQSAGLVLETLRAGIGSYGTPKSVFTDNGSQYVTWRGKSQFAHECQKRGIEHIVASPRRPQSLGKIERFWGSLWRECLESAVFMDLTDARLRIGHFIDHYNFQRAHQGIDGFVPADLFFKASPAVLQALSQRVAANAMDLAREGVPKAPFYLAGAIDGKPFSVHAEGERVILTRDDRRAEIDFDPRQDGTMPQPSSALPPLVAADLPPPAPPLPVATPAPLPENPAMPMPVSPMGMVPSGWTGAVESAPGASPLDALFPPPGMTAPAAPQEAEVRHDH
jgi:transposase InsO family protein